MALDLTQHGRGRVGGEAHLTGDIESVDGLHDAHTGNLHEVVEWLAAVGVLGGEGAGERERVLSELGARPQIAMQMDATQ